VGLYSTYHRISLRSAGTRVLQCHSSNQIPEGNYLDSLASPRILRMFLDGCNIQYFEEYLKLKTLLYIFKTYCSILYVRVR